MHDVTLAAAGTAAMLTVGLAAYAALILVSIAVALAAARQRRRRRAIAAATLVGALTVGGLVIAILSSIA
ncbi:MULTISPECIES: hypothetical protein [Mycolicibacterium]|uniref:Uncharacterized protein n=2 Tax=Mycolicibacterium TaxID=1866885 RepID=A0A9X2YLW9_9MYCO|nr:MULTISPECIES: hypothetical protein [Mycolicibacterium]MCV7170555.1 hypothetical protein [[Mycobacterium] manitobense]OJZ67751.1 hypothetical protein BRW64_05745 [Mycolicibacterium diernhoferi]OPE53507.1 hypothetical protein BV510_15195 [Mycolicibacterium diernhoferi]PEG51676.1 hypothetical protein CRI78_25325 [Mycolicibacterium diernhoferi]QYL20398.1 hypothetical protein K0O62_14885 [Mycolicibacterium diernhoferi]